jgi:sortase A
MLVRASDIWYNFTMKAKKLLGVGIALVAIGVLGFTVRRAAYYAPSDNSDYAPAALVLGTATTTTTTTGGTISSGTSTKIPQASTKPATSSPATTIPSNEASQPFRLEIPSIKVSAAIQYVGLKADGSMGTPAGFKDVAWYKYGPVPGAMGSAVIDGHVDNALALDGVFKHLGEVKVGDDVYVTQKNGTRLHFIVLSVESYATKDSPNQRIFTTVGGRYLNIITCAGIWVKGDHSYDQRLVVYTKLVP